MNEFEMLKQLGMDKWLWLQEGIIDHRKHRELPGTQAIGAVIPVTIGYFQETHKDFFDQLVKLIADGKLNRELDLQYGEEPIKGDKRYRTPCIVNATRTIQMHETFLSYQWCMSYAMYNLFLEKIDFPRVNAASGKVVKPISAARIQKAVDVFEYGKSLIPYFTPWDKDSLPNPERYEAAERDYVEQTNLLFTEGVKFILCHEVAHAKHHLDNMPPPFCDSCHQDNEFEADNDAIDTILRGAGANRFILEMGIVMGLLSMVFFSSTTTGSKHPNVEDRLTNALSRMKASDDSPAWAIACVGLELWDEQFSLNFDWKAKGKVSFKELYFDIVGQVKARQK